MAKLNQLPAPLDIQLVAGDKLNFTLRFKTGTPPTSPPLDLTGYTITSKIFVSRVRAGATSPPAVGTEVVTIGLTRNDTAGTVLHTVTETQSAQLANPDVLAFRWYMRWVSPGGVTRTVASGSIVGGTP